MIPKIYILDDDLTYARLLAANLGPVGRFRIDTFDRSEALLARLSEEPPDAVITDLVMPGPSGVEVTRPARSITPAPTPGAGSWRSTAPRCPPTCSRPSCSATRRGPSPTPGRPSAG